MAYVILVAGFLFLHRQDKLDIFAYICGISSLLVCVFIFILYIKSMSPKIIKSMTALFAGMAFLFAGNALIVSSIGVILKENGESSLAVGVVSSCFCRRSYWNHQYS